MKMPPKPKYNKKLNNILYIIILIIILYCILFYLDMINQLSLQNIVSVILGFLIMIIAQLRFISYYYEDRMKKYDLDQVGIVLDIIKNNIFGQININYIAAKQKIKYYHHTKDQNDKLFANQNQEIFDCVMTVLRSKNQVYNDNRVKILKEKWDVFIAKIGQFQVLLSNIYKLNKQRSTSYKQFHQKVLFLTEPDYQKWQCLFLKTQQNPQQHTQYLKQLNTYNAENWLQLKKIKLQKQNNMQSIIKQTSQLLVNQFNAYAIEMRNQLRKVSGYLQASLNQNIAIKKQYRDIVQKINVNNQKIQTQINKIKSKTKVSENMEFIFNAEYNLRFLRVQLSNLEIKLAYIKDNAKKCSQEQYLLCIKYQNHLQQSGIKKINNKISHYLLSYFDKIKSPLDKKKQTPSKLQKFQQFDQPTITTNEQQRRLHQFKSYIQNLITLTENQVTNLKRINTIMKDYQKQWKVKSSQFKYVQDSSISDKIVDSMFIQFIESVNKKQIDMLTKLINILQQQKAQIQLIQYNNPILKNNALSKQQYALKTKQNLSKRKSKQDIIQFSPNKIIELDNIQKNKMKSYLPQIFICFIEGYHAISKQIEDKKQFIQTQTKSLNVDNPKFVKMNQYKDQIFKLEREEFLKQEESIDKKDQKLLDQTSLLFINRIIDVFFLEWRNSDFFHGLLKEQIEISLNTKRPPFLSYMNVSYIKLHQKDQNTIKKLNVLSENVFICQFEAQIDFKGIIAVHIQTKANNKRIDIRLVIKQFHCPIRICFTPFSLGKSNVTMMKTPKLTVQYSAKIDGWQLTKIPFLSLFIELFIVVKLRKKFLFPKKATIKVPLAVKNAISQAIKERLNYEKLLQKKKKSD